MLTAISQRCTSIQRVGDVDCLEKTYVRFARRHGLVLVPIPNIGVDAGQYICDRRIKRVILSGGNDINPKRFGGIQSPDGDYSELRDVTEAAILQYALNRRIPLLGICRGMQFINVEFGGRLTRCSPDIDSSVSHVGSVHDLRVQHNELSSQLKGEIVRVNSYHKSCILKSDLAKHLTSFSQSSDGTIEGVFCRYHPVGGIMWHPERTKDSEHLDEILFRAFVNQDLFWKAK